MRRAILSRPTAEASPGRWWTRESTPTTRTSLRTPRSLTSRCATCTASSPSQGRPPRTARSSMTPATARTLRASSRERSRRGWARSPGAPCTPPRAATTSRTPNQPMRAPRPVEAPKQLAGMAPRARLVSLKVLGSGGTLQDRVHRVIQALAYVREVNGDGVDGMRIHGVNLSVGYEFDPRWFACGRSPLCQEVNRLVRSGVVVVVAAGNSGYGSLSVLMDAPSKFGLGMTINDPGNAELAITVGSTHRTAPHTYGVSYYSSKGPTGDGRDKPDLLAPG